MATVATQAPNLPNLAVRLIENGAVSHEAATRLHEKSKKNRHSFYTELVKSDTVDIGQLTELASNEFGLPLLEIESVDLSDAPIDSVSQELMNRHQVLPLFKRGTKLFIAVADPTDTRAIDDVKFHTGFGVEPILVNSKKLGQAIDHATEESVDDFDDLESEEDLDDIDISSEEDDANKDPLDERQIDTPIVRFVNKLLLDAIKKSASDIHFEPYERTTRVRLRIDGVLHEVAAPPVALAGRIAARIKILARLDIAERRVPQDGRMKLRLSKNRSIDFRVSTLPTLFGEKVVVRVLDTSAAQLTLNTLGFNDTQLEYYMQAVRRPYGMVLVTGPTGSGKTVSLYSALNMLNTSDKNISTVEDPVEINLVGINQVNINEKANLTFAAALRSFLRQDPDIIMVGEVRDLETADIAIKAAQTGHMVLSTLHTNDAPATLTRMLNMGVAPFNVASSVSLIMAQRLVRCLCTNCRQPVDIPPEALARAGFAEAEIPELQIYGTRGCDMCTGGYKGRIGIFQVMPLSEEMGSLIMHGCTQIEIEELAKKEGIQDLRQSGLEKIKNGVTTLEEVERVTNL